MLCCYQITLRQHQLQAAAASRLRLQSSLRSISTISSKKNDGSKSHDYHYFSNSNNASVNKNYEFYCPRTSGIIYNSTASDNEKAAHDMFNKKTTFKPIESITPKTPPPLFPWRHSPELLSRLIPGTPEFAKKSILRGSSGINFGHPLVNELATALTFLRIPWYELIFWNSWKQDFAASVSWAFLQGVRGILTNTYHVPTEDILKDEYKLDISLTLTENKEKNKNEKDSSKDDALLLFNNLMLEEKLRNLYQSAHESGKDQMQIRLLTEPFDATCYSLTSVPYLSRNNIKHDPDLPEFLRQMELKPANMRGEDLLYLKDKQLNSGGIESTVIAQVLVHCNEIFSVRDLQTGAVVQGHEDEQIRQVSHLVRVERTVKTWDEGGQLLDSRSDWQITDIDDLLDGNLMY